MRFFEAIESAALSSLFFLESLALLFSFETYNIRRKLIMYGTALLLWRDVQYIR